MFMRDIGVIFFHETLCHVHVYARYLASSRVRGSLVRVRGGGWTTGRWPRGGGGWVNAAERAAVSSLVAVSRLDNLTAVGTK